MISFTVALILLIVGYFTYGKFIERFVVKPDPKKVTPAYASGDGVDYVPLPNWKIFMIQFLNIAGLGPIFGAIMGAKFGTASYLWIVFGTIFAGAVHDYVSGMLSLRMNGESVPNMIGAYLGKNAKKIMIAFTVLLMILVGAVFVSGPAELLAGYTPEWMNIYFWTVVIFLYYMMATLFPIDAIIGRIYPFFAAALIFMALGLMFMLYWLHPQLPEVWNGLSSPHETNPIFPMMFVSIACGAISGFHSTQSPMMARCLKNEKSGRKIFYGAMVTEGIVALVWAGVATWFFDKYGTVNPETGKAFSAAFVAKGVSSEWLGTFGSFLVILGVVAAPITSGDTALRSARLIISEALHYSQKKVLHRIAVSFPVFACCAVALWYSYSDANGFAIIWRYFAWSNQVLATVVLWACTMYLLSIHRLYVVTLIPALFMTCVTTTYLFIAPECLHLSGSIAYPVGVAGMIGALVLFVWSKNRFYKKEKETKQE